jgi:hypothetical protein
MDEDYNLPNKLIVIRWIGRIFSVILFFLMGAFLLEHFKIIIGENDRVSIGLFLNPLFHFGLLCGYLVSLKWEKSGSIMIVVFSLLFLTFLKIPRQFVIFFLTLISPIYFYGYVWFQKIRLELD